MCFEELVNKTIDEIYITENHHELMIASGFTFFRYYVYPDFYDEQVEIIEFKGVSNLRHQIVTDVKIIEPNDDSDFPSNETVYEIHTTKGVGLVKVKGEEYFSKTPSLRLYGEYDVRKSASEILTWARLVWQSFEVLKEDI